MNVLVIGGTGHTGGFVVRGLVAQGHHVVCVSRGRTEPYLAGEFWKDVERVTLDRQEAETDGRLANLLADVQPVAVVDIVGFQPESAELLFESLAGKVQHLVHIGTAWVYGDAEVVPTPESYRGVPLNDYARKKLAMQDYYLARFTEERFPVTIVNPAQITGAGKKCITPEGDNDVGYLEQMRAGKEVPLPEYGRPLVQHVHPSDVARVILLALENTGTAIGQVYNAGSTHAMTYRGLFNFLRAHFRSDCKARLMSLEEYQTAFGPNETVTQHMMQSTCVDIRKAADHLGYRPAYTARQAVAEAVDDLMKRKVIGKI